MNKKEEMNRRISDTITRNRLINKGYPDLCFTFDHAIKLDTKRLMESIPDNFRKCFKTDIERTRNIFNGDLTYIYSAELYFDNIEEAIDFEKATHTFFRDLPEIYRNF